MAVLKEIADKHMYVLALTIEESHNARGSRTIQQDRAGWPFTDRNV